VASFYGVFPATRVCICHSVPFYTGKIHTFPRNSLHVIMKICAVTRLKDEIWVNEHKNVLDLLIKSYLHENI